MITLGASGTHLTLDVTGYQFPDAPVDEWDAAWLQVKGAVACESGRWSFQDPCMTASELTTLASWLIYVATQHESSEMGFLEPCLLFRRYESHPLGTIAVVFSHEACPPWVADDARFEGGFELRLDTSISELEAAGRQALLLADRYPDRGSRNVG
jgi:hypothetical protein